MDDDVVSRWVIALHAPRGAIRRMAVARESAPAHSGSTQEMEPAMPLASLSPFVVVHIWFAAGALLLGPFALSARKGSRLHRAMGYGWAT